MKKRSRPRIYDPRTPPPTPPYNPPPGASFDNGTWYDYAGHVLGYAQTETDPLRLGPKWWQDSSQGSPDNYYDGQNYLSPSLGRTSLTNTLSKNLGNALAARQSREYNAGQRGMPVPSIVPPRTSEQMTLSARTKQLHNASNVWNETGRDSAPGPASLRSSAGRLKSFKGPAIRKQAYNKLSKKL
jgi:hypothetical protein